MATNLIDPIPPGDRQPVLFNITDVLAGFDDSLSGTPTFSSRPSGLTFENPVIDGGAVTVWVTTPTSPITPTYQADMSYQTAGGVTDTVTMQIPVLHRAR